MMRSRKSGHYRNFGVLLIRLGLGVFLILFSYPNVFGGAETWIKTGEAARHLGIDFAPMFFGFMNGIIEFFGGIFLLLGLFFKPSLTLLVILMCMVTAKQIVTGEDFLSIAHSIELIIVFISLLFIGPGKYSLDYSFNSKYRRF